MGRLSKTFHEMQKKQHISDLTEPSVQERLRICQQLLDSILKTRSGVRKNKYKDELRNVHEFLCVRNQEYEELKKKYKELQTKNIHTQVKNTELNDRNIRLEFKLSNAKK